MLFRSDFAKVFSPSATFASLQSAPTIEDVKPSSNAMVALNNYQSPIPIINIWGEENSPTHWRWLSSTLYNDDNILPNQIGQLSWYP